MRIIFGRVDLDTHSFLVNLESTRAFICSRVVLTSRTLLRLFEGTELRGHCLNSSGSTNFIVQIRVITGNLSHVLIDLLVCHALRSQIFSNVLKILKVLLTLLTSCSLFPTDRSLLARRRIADWIEIFNFIILTRLSVDQIVNDCGHDYDEYESAYDTTCNSSRVTFWFGRSDCC